MTQPVRILVLDGETRAALACVRSLGRRGHRVEVVAAKPRSLAAASRHCAEEHVLPDPASDADGWAAALEELAGPVGSRDTRGDGSAETLVLPLTEITLGSLYSTGLQARIRAICPDRHAYEEAVDKHGLLERAAQCGCTVPHSRLIEHPDPSQPLPPGFDYPVVVKARRSRWLKEGRWQMGHVHMVADEAGWRAALADPGMGGGALVQSFIEGHGEAVFLLTEDGEENVHFAHRRLREKPPTGGVSVLRVAIEPDAELLDQSRRLLEGLHWTGVAMVEYRRTPGGDAALMEINPRLWGSLQLAIDAGIDFPALLVDQALGHRPASSTLRPGTRTRWLLGDVDHLLISLRRPAVRAITGATIGSLLMGFVASFFDGTRSEVFRWSDPAPFIRELRNWARGD